MKTFGELYQELGTVDAGDLSSNQQRMIYDCLRNTRSSEITTVEDHIHFIEILRKLRLAGMNQMQFMGQNFMNMIQSVLSVGEDGLYSNHIRFFYELVQNVDDCDYDNVEDCKLDIEFRYEKEPAQIIFTYNEKGFTPENVFAITGIAEKSKNVSKDKTEIGEKGIGFKSVFGIADKVRIQSGMFSFDLYRNNFTVPVPAYDDFEPQKGTRLTLEMPAIKCKGIYEELVKEYLKPDALLNKNPILFLNKLTHLRMFFDAYRYMEFNVERCDPDMIGDISREQNVKVSVDMFNHVNGMDFMTKEEVTCCRYSIPVTYGRIQCRARYGEKVEFSERYHNLIAVFPLTVRTADGEKDYMDKGVMYSFLPTQIHLKVPVLIHASFKLDSSREFVDPQGENEWFTYTISHLGDFLKKVYVDLAHTLREKALRYVPTKNSDLFERDNEKVRCLQVDSLKGAVFCDEEIFYCVDESFERASDVVAFEKDEKMSRERAISAYGLLYLRGKLFIPEEPTNMAAYGCKVLPNVSEKIFEAGLEDSDKFEDALKWLKRSDSKIDYEKLLEEYSSIALSEVQLLTLSQKENRKVLLAFQEDAAQSINDRQDPRYIVVEDVPVLEDEKADKLEELLKDVKLDSACAEYLKNIDGSYFAVDTGERLDDFELPCQNGLVLSRQNELNAFAKFSEHYDKDHTFSASLRLSQASERLNDLSNVSISNEDYLESLYNIRSSVRRAYGKRMYENYIQIIQKAGVDKSRFLNELLQNADDCEYEEGAEPWFLMKKSRDMLETSYNEKGFTKQNVRAITAIGESTKSALLSNGHEQIGEKGVGFKSVFGIARSVEIHSNGFDFKLTDELPTVPQILKVEAAKNDKIDTVEDRSTPAEEQKAEDQVDSVPVVEEEVSAKVQADKSGTRMVFSLKTNLPDTFSAHRILNLCLCLRNLKRLSILGHSVVIKDTESKRIILFDNEEYRFERIEYPFTVTDEQALEERQVGSRTFDTEQKIVCYIPEKNMGENPYLYCGLPISSIRSNVPLIIDAPFELTTSRDEILNNSWNKVIRENVYFAIIDLISRHADEGIDALRFVGFSRKDNVLRLANFTETSETGFDINDFSWREKLEQIPLLPVLGSDQKVKAFAKNCVIVPDFLGRLDASARIDLYINGQIINTVGKAQYVPLLEYMGCKKVNADSIFFCLHAKTEDFIVNTDFRKGLYQYLSGNQGNNNFDGIGERALELPIFPILTHVGVQFVPFNDDLYQSDHMRTGYQIIDKTTMSPEVVSQILTPLGKQIPELTQQVLDNAYQDNLIEFLKGTATDGMKVDFLLKEYERNSTSFSRCRYTLKGMIDQIPLLMEDGSYQYDTKYRKMRYHQYQGDILTQMIVDDSCDRLAEFLNIGFIEDIHYYDLENTDLDEISDEDMADFEKLNHYEEIIKGLIYDGYLSSEQIQEYGLDFAEDSYASDDDLYDEDFPGKAIKDYSRLKVYIHNQWEHKNPYEARQYKKWIPHIDSGELKEYVVNMYQSQYNTGRCFCQMCGNMMPARYIEVNEIEKKPVYAWPQMRLSLCLTCSKDYILLRNNDHIWKVFVQNILEADPQSDATIDIQIGEDKSVSFTATHLAEIQEILKKEGYPDHPMERHEDIEEKTDEEAVEKILSRIERNH